MVPLEAVLRLHVVCIIFDTGITPSMVPLQAVLRLHVVCMYQKYNIDSRSHILTSWVLNMAR